jgi:hypothetical protein
MKKVDKHIVTAAHKAYHNRSKTWRRSRLKYRSEYFDYSCRHHGSCPYCHLRRLHNTIRRELNAREEMAEFIKDPNGWDARTEAELWGMDEDDPTTPQEYLDPAFLAAWETYQDRMGGEMTDEQDQWEIDNHFDGDREAWEKAEVESYLEATESIGRDD